MCCCRLPGAPSPRRRLWKLMMMCKGSEWIGFVVPRWQYPKLSRDRSCVFLLIANQQQQLLISILRYFFYRSCIAFIVSPPSQMMQTVVTPRYLSSNPKCLSFYGSSVGPTIVGKCIPLILCCLVFTEKESSRERGTINDTFPLPYKSFGACSIVERGSIVTLFNFFLDDAPLSCATEQQPTTREPLRRQRDRRLNIPATSSTWARSKKKLNISGCDVMAFSSDWWLGWLLVVGN